MHSPASLYILYFFLLTIHVCSRFYSEALNITSLGPGNLSGTCYHGDLARKPPLWHWKTLALNPAYSTSANPIISLHNAPLRSFITMLTFCLSCLEWLLQHSVIYSTYTLSFVFISLHCSHFLLLTSPGESLHQVYAATSLCRPRLFRKTQSTHGNFMRYHRLMRCFCLGRAKGKLAGKLFGKWSDKWKHQAVITYLYFSEMECKNWANIIFSCLLWEFVSLYDLWIGFVSAVINVRITAHLRHLGFVFLISWPMMDCVFFKWHCISS